MFFIAVIYKIFIFLYDTRTVVSVQNTGAAEIYHKQLYQMDPAWRKESDTYIYADNEIEISEKS